MSTRGCCPAVLLPPLQQRALSAPDDHDDCAEKAIIGLQDLRPGDIVLFPPEHHNDQAGHIIAFLTGEPVTHAALVYRDPTKIIEMRWDTVGGDNLAIMPADRERFKGYSIYVNRLKDSTPETVSNVLDAADDFRNRQEPFGWSNIYMLAIVLLTRKLTVVPGVPNTLALVLQFLTPRIIDFYNSLKLPGASPMHCSQFVSLCFEKAGAALVFSNPVIPVLSLTVEEQPAWSSADPGSVLDQVRSRVAARQFEPQVSLYTLKQNYTSGMISDTAVLEDTAEAELNAKLSEFYEQAKSAQQPLSGKFSQSAEANDGNVLSDNLSQAVCDFAVAVSKVQNYVAPHTPSNIDILSALGALVGGDDNNVFITPGDLLNRTTNLEAVGNIEVEMQERSGRCVMS